MFMGSLHVALSMSLAAAPLASAAIIPSWRVNPISQAAIDNSGGLLQYAFSQSLMIELTNGSLFNVAGLDLDLGTPGLSGFLRFYQRIGGGASNGAPPPPDLILTNPAAEFDTYVCTTIPDEPAATPGRLNGTGAAQIGNVNLTPS